MKFDVPIAEAVPLVEEARELLDGPVQDLIADHRRNHEHKPRLEPDGSLAEHVREFKGAVHRTGAEAGLYAPHVSKRLGGRCTSLRASMYLHEEVFLRGFQGQQWILAIGAACFTAGLLVGRTAAESGSYGIYVLVSSIVATAALVTAIFLTIAMVNRLRRRRSLP